MTVQLSYQFDQRRSRAGRLHLKVALASDVTSLPGEFTSLESAIFTGTTTLNISNSDRTVLCVAPIGSLRFLPGVDSADFEPVALREELLGVLGDWSIIAVAVGPQGTDLERDVYRVLANFALAPEQSRASKRRSRPEDPDALKKLIPHSLFVLSGNRYTPANATCVPLHGGSEPGLARFRISVTESIGGIRDVQRHAIATALHAELAHISGTNSLLTLLELNGVGWEVDRLRAWYAAFLTHKPTAVLAATRSPGENIFVVVGTRLETVECKQEFTLDSRPTGTPTGTIIQHAGRAAIPLLEWLRRAP